jgi:hypothetical protein
VTADRLGEVAVLVDRLRRAPDTGPPQLTDRWTELQDRAGAALDCGPRVRELLGAGEVLMAHRLLASLRHPDTPAWATQALEADARAFGWPALMPPRLVAESIDPGDTTLPERRLVRFREGEAISEGRVQRCTATDVTVRISSAAGYSFPVVPRSRVEPVDPTPEEALEQGRVAAAAGDDLGVLLWICCLNERGHADLALQLSALLNL